MKKISVILGSKSDLPQVEGGFMLLDDFKIGYELKILSAHRNTAELKRYVKGLERRGIRVVIACAGLSAALPGVVSSYISIPVIGVPLYSKAFKGIDSLLSILQMPKGIPVAAVTVGSSGMINAVLLAATILALSDRKLKARIKRYRGVIKNK
ncbi:MAG: 5-(carboxyamino)imidazole ribonucleotide mutase [Candidatus Omnitrophica bacterium]|nr:5-(carboxyamino)imidazole ribonucleotide mutase [Candidatus Omnitrophota bacterium]